MRLRQSICVSGVVVIDVFARLAMPGVVETMERQPPLWPVQT